MQPSHNIVPVAYRPPFAFGALPWSDARPHGESILEIVRSVPNLPREFIRRGIVCINGEVVPRELWSYVRPKPATEHLPVAVTLHLPLGSPGGGGGGGSSKSIVALVAAIALIAITAVIAGPFGAGLLSSVGISGTFLGITAAQAVAGAVGIAGALAIGALTAPPTQSAQQVTAADNNSDNKEPASAQGNILAIGGSVPRVIGTRKIYPPLIAEPLVYLSGTDEIVEAIFALNGPHAISDLRVDGTDVTSTDDVQSVVFAGLPDDDTSNVFTRYGKTITPQITLSQHILDADNSHLKDQSSPTDDIPIWHGFVSRNAPDEVWVHLLFPGGIALGSNTNPVRVPFRIRARKRGDVSWINFPEVHAAGNSTDQLRLAILFKWQAAPAIDTVSPSLGWVYAHRATPPQTNAPATPTAWVADGYFDDGAGNNYLFNGNEGSTRLRNLNLYQDRLEFYLDAGTFVPGIWEIQITRGCTYLPSNFTQTTYVYSGSVFDFFWYRNTTPGTIVIAQDQDNVSDHAIITRVASVWNQSPYNPQITGQYFATIGILARNRQIQRLSVTASGYVPDWDGSGWNTLTTTSNPAPHYADVLCGSLNLDPLSADLRDDAGLVTWRQLCIDNTWLCDAIIGDMRTQDVLALLASCGYAKPYQSDVYGVTVDNDRTGDSPVQVFSRINASNVKFEKAFVRAPAGFLVNFYDGEEDDDHAQLAVFQSDPNMPTTGLFESITYDGLIYDETVQARAQFDLDQANLRSTFYSLETDIESIVCRRGSLVALQHDVLTSRAGDGHVVSKQTSGGNITGITLDSQIDIVSGNTGVAIRRTDGSITTHTISNSTGLTSVLTFTSPFADTATIIGFNDTNREYGCLVVVGELSAQYKRMLVAQITATKDLKASLVLVDEAPQLVRFSGF